MKILLAGKGGQGVQAVAEILAQAAFSEGKKATYIPNFGVEQRGGVSLAFLIIDEKTIGYPKFETADILAIFSDRSVERVQQHRDQKTKVILGPAVKGGIRTKLPPITWNVFLLGRVNRLGKMVSRTALVKAMEKRFARQFKKNQELKELDLEALNEGL